jgi:tRNA A-37 threonylcarbamoyl transferase component Bud32
MSLIVSMVPLMPHFAGKGQGKQQKTGCYHGFTIVSAPMTATGTDYLAFGRALIEASPGARTICADAGGRRVWVKKTVPPKGRIWHVLQKFAAFVLRRPIMRCTVSEGGGGSLHMEAARLIEFRNKGFHVPEVLAVNDEMLVLSDAGPQLRAVLDKTEDREAQLALLQTAMVAMAGLHAAGMVHGRPYMRDMTWDGGTIGFLDLEENPLRVMPLRSGQARDVWVFLSAACRYARVPGPVTAYREEVIRALFEAYRPHASAEALEELRSFVKFLEPVQKFLQKNLWQQIGTDARQSVFANYCLTQLL